MSLDISLLFFHTVPELVQALVITYDDIFQGLTVEGVLLPKPFLDLGFAGVFRCKPQDSEISFSLCQARGSARGPSPSVDTVKAEDQKWLRQRDAFYRQALEDAIVCYDKCLNKSGDCVEK
jgi:hypothetical protein